MTVIFSSSLYFFAFSTNESCTFFPLPSSSDYKCNTGACKKSEACQKMKSRPLIPLPRGNYYPKVTTNNLASILPDVFQQTLLSESSNFLQHHPPDSIHMKCPERKMSECPGQGLCTGSDCNGR